MRIHSRLAPLALLVSLLVPAADAFGQALPEFDATFATLPAARRANATRLAPEIGRVARVRAWDERFGVPSFVWGTARSPRAGREAVRSGAKPSFDSAARSHFASLAPLYGLDRDDVAAARQVARHDLGSVAAIVTYRAEFAGIPVFRDAAKVCLDRDGQLVALSGYLPSRSALPAAGAKAFVLPAARGAALALADFAGLDAPPAMAAPSRATENGDEYFESPTTLKQRPDGGAVERDVRTRKVWFHLGEGLEPAWYVEVLGENAAYAYVFSAADGRLLLRHSLQNDVAFGYRVWAGTTGDKFPMDGPQGDAHSPHPTGLPNLYNPSLLAPNLVSLQNGPISASDPWLDAAATFTLGNNVDAYVDIASPDGLTAGDFRAPASAAGLFDWTYNTALNPGANATQRNAAITTLFYLNNWLHDWWYDSGFDEVSGNAQGDNFGRGGWGGDVLHAEGQDYGGTNNANMATPSDGGSPRMQMYVFNPAGGVVFNVTAPGAIAGTYYSGASAFGAQTFSVTDTVVAAVDNAAPTNDACSAITNNVSGKIALIDRGTCTFAVKAQNAQTAGAVAAIIVNNVSGQAPTVTGTATVTIPVVSLSQSDGALLRAQLTGGATVLVTLSRAANIQRDGTIDGHIVAHEWMHYMTNRLVGDAAGLSTQQAGGMGEGWSDFSSLLMTARSGDNLQGVFAMAPYALSNSAAASNVYYYGIRRYPYSYDMSKNPLTFRHIQDGQTLPAGPPLNGDNTGATNSEVHRTGEVWCSMLWDCFVALASDSPRLTFEQARERMKSYIVGGLKLTPNAPTITEARDAILAVAIANDTADGQLIAQAFARRGCGTGAVSPPRTSVTNTGVVESYAVGGELAIASISMDDDLASCDHDGYMDNGERGTLTVHVDNMGVSTLTGTTLSLISTNPHVTFPGGNTLNVPATTPFTATSVSIPVDVSGATAEELAEFWVSVDDPALAVAGPRTALFRDYLHADEGAAATDIAEAHHTTWLSSGYGGSGWTSVELGAGSHAYHVDGAGGTAEVAFTTAPITVAASGNFTVSFQHRWSFEYDATYDYDGGVIELSSDGGANWVDVGASVTPGYTGTLTNQSFNPLGGRAAWTKQSAGYPSMTSATLNLGTACAGQTVLLRFKHAADAGVGSPGWWVDNVILSGVTNAPFVSLSPELDACSALAVDGEPRPDRVALTLSGAHPVRGMAQLRFSLPAPARVRLTVLDLAGRAVAELADGEFGAGWHAAAFSRDRDGSRPAPGVYFARLEVDGRRLTHRFVLMQ